MKMLSISQIMEKMIAFSEGNIHEIGAVCFLPEIGSHSKI